MKHRPVLFEAWPPGVLYAGGFVGYGLLVVSLWDATLWQWACGHGAAVGLMTLSYALGYAQAAIKAHDQQEE